MGPKKQIKSMAKPQRAGCAAAFVFFFIMTLVVCFTGGNFIVIFVCAGCQVRERCHSAGFMYCGCG